MEWRKNIESHPYQVQFNQSSLTHNSGRFGKLIGLTE